MRVRRIFLAASIGLIMFSGAARAQIACPAGAQPVTPGTICSDTNAPALPCTDVAGMQMYFCNAPNVNGTPVPELPEILMPALLVGAGAVAYRARKKALKKRVQK